ncbi:hypothetical protein AVEN_67855-1 [Araneus ventricosus]|uniref:Uncharacterized protein n=1 Tax=Araneus ventricosus TaxID=182803 RepID=A0A4Y2TL92_ARAVE|nr:hypothetical protein AVEN_242944-1 [Araneus ventricosus]GBO01379.1 hypothetical protein AVEN_67855-1 [Araneus ventricosus]
MIVGSEEMDVGKTCRDQRGFRSFVGKNDVVISCHHLELPNGITGECFKLVTVWRMGSSSFEKKVEVYGGSGSLRVVQNSVHATCGIIKIS